MGGSSGARVERSGPWVLFAAFAFVLLRTAWLDDDCFITLRVVDNFVHGYGLRWNVAERVQVFSHPLWLFLVSGFYFFTREAYFTTVFVSLGVSLAAAYLYITRVAGSGRGAIVGVALFVLSRSFVEYSTSGLENPLTHLLLVSIFVTLLRCSGGTREFFVLSLLSGLAILNRDDLALLVLPVLIGAYRHVPKLRGALWGAAGMAPLVLWKAFSLVYYGALVPNTAYAKLHTGLPEDALFAQGLRYVADELVHDPVSVTVMALAALSMLTRRGRLFAASWVGVLLYLAYVVAIGGCFMSGRLFAAPFLVSVLILTDCLRDLKLAGTLASLAAVGTLGLALPQNPALLTGGDYGGGDLKASASGITDERRFYYPGSGLLPNLGKSDVHPRHEFIWLGLSVKDKPEVLAITASGLAGYFGGPKVHWVDVYAIGDPLLARLPSRRHVRIGHFKRMLPEGYLETLRTGEDHFEDRNLGEYYRQIRLITRGPIWSAERWRAVWRLHRGQFEPLIDRDFYARGYVRQASLESLFKLENYFLPFSQTYVSPESGLEVALDRVEHGEWLDVAIERGRSYSFAFSNRGVEVGKTQASLPNRIDDVLIRTMIRVPQSARDAGYERIRIRAGGPGEASIGQVRLAPQYAVDVPLEALSTPREDGTFWLAPGAIELLPSTPLHVHLGAIRHARRVNLSLDHNDAYRLVFLKGGARVDALPVKPPLLDGGGGLSNVVASVPARAVEAGYDEIEVAVTGGDPLVSIGHLLLD